MYTFVAASEDNKAKYTCEARNELSAEAMTAQIVLAVQCKYLWWIEITFEMDGPVTFFAQAMLTVNRAAIYRWNEISFPVAPDEVTIEGPTEAKVNDSLDFECKTSNSNPAATVQWVVDGRTVHATFATSVSHTMHKVLA